MSPDHQAEPRCVDFSCVLPDDVHIAALASTATGRVGLSFGSSLHAVATTADWPGLWQRIGDALRSTGVGIPVPVRGVTPDALRSTIAAAMDDIVHPHGGLVAVMEQDVAAIADAVLRLLEVEG